MKFSRYMWPNASKWGICWQMSFWVIWGNIICIAVKISYISNKFVLHWHQPHLLALSRIYKASLFYFSIYILMLCLWALLNFLHHSFAHTPLCWNFFLNIAYKSCTPLVTIATKDTKCESCHLYACCYLLLAFEKKASRITWIISTSDIP